MLTDQESSEFFINKSNQKFYASTLKKNKQFENENVTLNLEMFQYSNCNNPLVIFRNKTSNEKYL